MSTRQLFVQHALIGHHWRSGVIMVLDEQGKIEAISTGANWQDLANSGFPSIVHAGNLALPTMPNVHSHAFQRGFVGLSEFRSPASTSDSFWSWREAMYAYLRNLNVDQVYQIGRQLYGEMLQAGYGIVGEFQYLHRQCDGSICAPVSQISEKLVQAAVDAGLPICILPVIYHRGGFDGRELTGDQRRFFLELEEMEVVLHELKSSWQNHPLVSFGIAIHSLRAVAPQRIEQFVELATSVFGHCPIHIHVAEQVAEVDACLNSTGMRPVELLLKHAAVDERWCLVHATHMDDAEIQAVAESRAVVGACPTTEANLGDGILRAVEFAAAGGRLAIGSDSHIAINPRSELRGLEYSQRLRDRQRAMLCQPNLSCGQWLYQEAAAAGASVLGRACGSLEVGKFADFIVLNDRHSVDFLQNPARILDKFVFVELEGMIQSTWIAGRQVTNRPE